MTVFAAVEQVIVDLAEGAVERRHHAFDCLLLQGIQQQAGIRAASIGEVSGIGKTTRANLNRDDSGTLQPRPSYVTFVDGGHD
ncbi:MAG: hypothetical protein IPF45_04485 [Thermomonas sp.]|nr:hypothetical protein [Thermomonas sp.]